MPPARDLNPYAPAGDEDDPPPSDDGRRAFRPATLDRRLLGALIDGLFSIAVLYVLRTATLGEAPSWRDLVGARPGEQPGLVNLASSVIPLAVMAALIATRGQSVGKIVIGTRIVDGEGRRAGLVNGFVMRTLPFTVLALVPTILVAAGSAADTVQTLSLLTGFVSFADAVAIFATGHRCLHDRIAGTHVAIVGSERASGGARKRPKNKKKKRPAAASDGDQAA